MLPLKTATRPRWILPATIDGEPFEGGSGENVDVVLGSGSFLPGFEAQIEGMKRGESRDDCGDLSG